MELRSIVVIDKNGASYPFDEAYWTVVQNTTLNIYNHKDKIIAKFTLANIICVKDI